MLGRFSFQAYAFRLSVPLGKWDLQNQTTLWFVG